MQGLRLLNKSLQGALHHRSVSRSVEPLEKKVGMHFTSLLLLLDSTDYQQLLAGLPAWVPDTWDVTFIGSPLLTKRTMSKPRITGRYSRVVACIRMATGALCDSTRITTSEYVCVPHPGTACATVSTQSLLLSAAGWTTQACSTAPCCPTLIRVDFNGFRTTSRFFFMLNQRLPAHRLLESLALVG